MAMMLLLLLQLLILVIRFVAIVFVVTRGLPTLNVAVAATITVAAAVVVAVAIAVAFQVPVLAVKGLDIDLIEMVAGILDAHLWTHRLTSVRESDSSLRIDNGTEHEITVMDGLVEVAGIAQLRLQVDEGKSNINKGLQLPYT